MNNRNLSETRLKVYQFFKDNDTLVLPDNFLQVVTISENVELDIALIKAALESFETAGILKKVIYSEKNGKKLEEKTAYVLEKPIYAHNSSIELPGDLNLLISETINASKDKDDPNPSDPTRITHSDIESLLIIIRCQNLMLQKQKNEEK